MKCEPPGDPEAAATKVPLELDEFSIKVNGTATAGTVAFQANNIGEEPHELVVVKADTVASLPLDTDGALNEAELDDGALVGEIEPFPAASQCDGGFTLAAGSYVLLCNIVEEEDGEKESHLKEGMVTTLTVE